MALGAFQCPREVVSFPRQLDERVLLGEAVDLAAGSDGGIAVQGGLL